MLNELKYNESLTIKYGSEAISWIKKDLCTFRRIHRKNNKIVSVSLSKRIEAEETELSFRLSTGFEVSQSELKKNLIVPC